jgi:preprotein translocase subunit SecF
VTALRLACVLTLVGLALMTWSMLDATWLPVMVAMTVGQLVGTTAFVIFAVTIVRDLKKRIREAPP